MQVGETPRKDYDFEYVSNEQVPQLMDWFRIDFTQYRIFDCRVEAEEYLNNKIS